MMESKRESEKENKRENKTEDRAGFGGPLYRKLREYGESDYYGFHMPGHKRQLGYFENPYKFDITEIDGFDDLHHPEKDGVLTMAQERAAGLYGAEETHFLINGSTAGILSAISGCTRRGGRILMARNCHRSVYHAAELGGLEAEYLYPQQIASPGINGPVLPEDVERALTEKAAFSEQEKGRYAREAAGRFQAVVITSPTYDGICSDVRAIAKICHRHEVPLIVDQAHGAHFPFSDYFPEDAVSAGADVVIHSVHKTLPSLTQTAIIHWKKGWMKRERLEQYLHIYQSSSPSYVFLAGMQACVEKMDREGRNQLTLHGERMKQFIHRCSVFSVIRVLNSSIIGKAGVHDWDWTRLVIMTKGHQGERLYQMLRDGYHLQMEMATPDYVVAITSMADTEEGLERLFRALAEIDRIWCREEILDGDIIYRSSMDRRGGRQVISPYEASLCEKKKLDWNEAKGTISAETAYIYPPGIPFLMPGEEILQEHLDVLNFYKEMGIQIKGISDPSMKQLQVIERLKGKNG